MSVPRRLSMGVMVLSVALAAVAARAQNDDPASAPGDGGDDADASSLVSGDERIDKATGRDTRVWPRDPLFVHKHFKLEMTVPDMSRSAFTGVATFTLTPIAHPQSEIVLDAGPTLKFKQVTVNGASVEYTHAAVEHRVAVRLGREFAPGEQIVLRMAYGAARAGGNGLGLTWSKDDSRTPETDYMMHSQGQAQSNHLWFPCHDFPNVRVPTELIVTVPEPYEAVSNGRLVGVTRKTARISVGNDGATESRPMVTHHWLQEKPHVYYLVAVVIGRFDVVNVGGPDSKRPGLWMPVYGPLGSAERLKTLFANTAEMMAYFEDLFGMAFPWDKYAQIICRDFDASAMENTSASTFNDYAARGGRAGSLDVDIAHELTHQWFGDFVTCATWEHVWLNESWATLGEALWAEKRRGENAYQAAMLRNAAGERTRSGGRRRPVDEGMVSARYHDPDERFTGPDNVYRKGGLVLHMLRQRLGDEVFFEAGRQFLREHSLGLVETTDFRRTLERAAGAPGSLEKFFAQWVERPGHPELAIEYDWAAKNGAQDGAGVLTVRVDQTQPIDEQNPAYAFELPLLFKFRTEKDAPSRERWVKAAVDSRESVARFELEEKPEEVQVDPKLTVLSRNRIRQPLAESMRQLGDSGGRSTYARYQALLALEETEAPEAAAAVRELVMGSDDEEDALLREVARGVLARIEGRLEMERVSR